MKQQRGATPYRLTAVQMKRMECNREELKGQNNNKINKYQKNTHT